MISKDFKNYQLLDSGLGRKLESIAGVKVIRPSPQAIWKPRMNEANWQMANSVVHRTKDGGGTWEHKKPIPETLTFDHLLRDKQMKMKLKFTSFGHCGVFFEQIEVWSWLFDQVTELKAKLGRAPKVMNLFGYTGGASIAMAMAGAEVFHVDSSKGVLTWGKESQALSKVPEKNIRWVQEDAQEFLKHSFKKNFTYDGVLADPPSWGHGAKKELWDFDKHMSVFIDLLHAVIEKNNSFIFLSSHTQGVQQEALRNLLAQEKRWKNIECGELGVAHQNDERILPAGIFARGKSF